MQNFDLMRNVTIGQYIPTGSPIHRLDPRTKILAATFLILGISFNASIVANTLFLLLVLVITYLSRVPVRYMLRGFILGLPVLVLIFVMQLFFQGWTEPAGKVYFQWGILRATRYSFQLMAISLFRVISFIFLTSLITMTATTTELTHGVESILKPLRRIGLPSHELALILMISLRFVPTLAEEMERIMKAQASRGADISRQGFWRPDKAARMILPLIVPLFMSAFRRAEDLVLAMEARCYVGGEGRTKYVELHARPVDYVVVIVSFLFMLLLIFYPWPSVRAIMAALGLPDVL
ncbi:MAG: energy-coupling factor transporter transmembrane protein EcfT [Caldilineaceae bacterium]|nr:energy-coupling factor transporter transmembrane protein EcfT [Caldilineaceae bacterium]MCB9136771.1 energy-coupling factor transporter transmembrane protein EcfT [Caldilineaceae bacterium]